MHELGQRRELTRVRRGDDAVTEVEDVSGRRPTLRDDPSYLTVDDVPRREEQCRIEVPLDGVPAAEPLHRVAREDAGRQADRVDDGEDDGRAVRPGIAVGRQDAPRGRQPAARLRRVGRRAAQDDRSLPKAIDPPPGASPPTLTSSRAIR